MRSEDLAWREHVRAEDRAERYALHAQSLQCLTQGLAFVAAAQNSRPDASGEELARKAKDLIKLIGS